MSTDYIISLPTADDVWDDDPESPTYNPRPPSALANVYGINTAYLTQVTEGWPATAVLVGAWDSETGLQLGQTYDYGTEEAPNDPPLVVGTPTHPVLPEYNAIAKFHNEQGMATGERDTIRYQGHSERKFTEDAEPYPSDRRPFYLKITRELITDDGFPQIPWGWRVYMISEDPQRDITARGIGVYSDPECTQYQYTTGSFIDDGSGNYFTECPVGQRKAEAEPVYFALLLGSLQEGYMNLNDLEEGATTTNLYWADAIQTLDVDRDGIPDKVVEVPELTTGSSMSASEDDDSINIDLDGDGKVDLIIPKN